jgi:hypothetical protein
MPLHGQVVAAPDGVRGFDVNQRLSAPTAAAFYAYGYRFCARYIRRKSRHDYDLTAAEAQELLAAGLGLMVVQHVAPEGWTPTADVGREYGSVAAAESRKVGVPDGVTIWCDLEGVARGTPARQIIDFCNRWHAEVEAAGYDPGLYVGDAAGLTPSQLYASLRFTHYWGAYNLSIDQVPAVRGLQMKQSARKARDKVPGFNFAFQVDLVGADALGGRPTLLARPGWPE